MTYPYIRLGLNFKVIQTFRYQMGGNNLLGKIGSTSKVLYYWKKF